MADPQIPDRLPANFDFSKPISVSVPDRLPANFDFAAQKPAMPEQWHKNEQAIAARELAPDAGFLNTIGSDIMDAPKKLMDAATGHPVDAAIDFVRDATAARLAHRPLAAEAFHKGDYISAFGHAMASILPFAGPMAAQAGEEIGGGQPGQGLAHAAELVAPFAAGPAADAVGKMPELRSPVTVEPGKFVTPLTNTAMKVAEPFLPPIAKATVKAMGIGANAESVPAGALRRLQFQSPFVPEASTRTPVWAGSVAPGRAPIPDVTPIRSPLPSGRAVPGPEGADLSGQIQKSIEQVQARKAGTAAVSGPVKPEAATFKADAQLKKATVVAQALHDNGIPLTDAKLIEPEQWSALAKSLGVNELSPESINQTLLQLGKLEKGSPLQAAKVRAINQTAANRAKLAGSN